MLGLYLVILMFTVQFV